MAKRAGLIKTTVSISIHPFPLFLNLRHVQFCQVISLSVHPMQEISLSAKYKPFLNCEQCRKHIWTHLKLFSPGTLQSINIRNRPKYYRPNYNWPRQIPDADENAPIRKWSRTGTVYLTPISSRVTAGRPTKINWRFALPNDGEISKTWYDRAAMIMSNTVHT